MTPLLDKQEITQGDSRRHASIQFDKELERFQLLDCKSLNGVAVNGIRIHRAELQDGDVIQLGGAAQVKVKRKLTTEDASVKYRFRLKSNEGTRLAPESVQPIPESEPSIKGKGNEDNQARSGCALDVGVIRCHLTCALCG